MCCCCCVRVRVADSREIERGRQAWVEERASERARSSQPRKLLVFVPKEHLNKGEGLSIYMVLVAACTLSSIRGRAGGHGRDSIIIVLIQS